MIYRIINGSLSLKSAFVSVVIGAFYFFYFAGMGIWVIFAPKTLLALGYSAFQIGIVFAITPLVRFLTPFLFLNSGSVTKKQFLVSSLVTFISTIFFAFFVNNFFLFALNILIFSVFWVVILPYADSIALENIPAKKYGKIRLFGSIGFMLIGIALGEYANSATLVYVLYVLFSLITLIFCFFLSSLDVKQPNTDENKVAKVKFNPFADWPMWVSMFLLQFSFGAFYNFFTIYETSHGISLSTTTYLWAFGVICEIVMFLVQGRFIDRINPVSVIKFTTIVTVIRWMLLYIFPSSLFASFVSQSFHAINFALYTTAVFLYISHKFKDNKKLAQMFFYGVSYGLGGFLGALFSGYFYSQNIYLYSAIAAFFGFVVLYMPGKAAIKSV
jgi:PPP family 3-phenylpropionic acid transporter